MATRSTTTPASPWRPTEPGSSRSETPGGLEVSDLNPAAQQFSVLSGNGSSVIVPVLCPAPHGRCSVRASITLGAHLASASASHAATGALLDGASFTVPAGAARKLKVPLSAAIRRALRVRRGRVRATLSLTLRASGWSHTTTASVTLRG